MKLAALPAIAAILISAGCGSQSPLTAAPPPATATKSAGGWQIQLLPAAWRLTGFQEDKDLSGIAAWDATHCLVCSDELRTIQPGRMNREAGSIVAGPPIPLLPGAAGDTEVDAEGVAVSREDSCYYVTGSHGVGKKKADFQESRCRVIRIPVDPASGEPVAAGIQTASILPWAAGDATLGQYVHQPLQLNGFNIEGLTYKNGRLWFGLRAPNEKGDAFVIEAGARALFSGAADARLHRLPVGMGQGIREIAALREGFLVLTGNASAEATKKQPRSMALGGDQTFRLFLWNPAASPAVTFIGVLPSPSAKAEGLLILEETPAHIDVLVLFDGSAGGGPKVYRLVRA